MSNFTTTPFLPETVPTVSHVGLRLAGVDWRGLVHHIFASLEAGRGRLLITASLDVPRPKDRTNA
jgi:hypothetical protein